MQRFRVERGGVALIQIQVPLPWRKGALDDGTHQLVLEHRFGAVQVVDRRRLALA